MKRVIKWVLDWLGFYTTDTIYYIGGSDVLPPPLKGEEELLALEELGQGSEQAKQRLIEHNLRLVVYIARRFESTGVNLEDLISIGTIGLIKGIGNYRREKNIKLATYASRCIENEILMYFRSRRKSSQDVSLSDYIETGADGTALSLMEVVREEDDLLEQVEARENARKLRRAVDSVLTDQEREVVVLRYGLDGRPPQRQREVADRTGISRSYVSRIEKKALEKLRKAMEQPEA